MAKSRVTNTGMVRQSVSTILRAGRQTERQGIHGLVVVPGEASRDGGGEVEGGECGDRRI